MAHNQLQKQQLQKQQLQKQQALKLLEHPNLWRAGQLADQQRQAHLGIPTGFAELDQHLPAQGWPRGGLLELMPSVAGIGELRLLAPALKTLSQTETRWVAWVNPPFIPYAPALKALGIDIGKMLLIHPKSHQDNLWALERAIKSGTCSMVLAWVDEKKLKLKDTQRLQIAAKQGGTLACLLRPVEAQQQASMAELRLALQPTEQTGAVNVDVCKRRAGWPLQNLFLNFAEATNTQHLSTAEIQVQLAQWRAMQPRCTQSVDADASFEPLPASNVMKANTTQPHTSQPVQVH